jgi:hypothetical protein
VGAPLTIASQLSHGAGIRIVMVRRWLPILTALLAAAPAAAWGNYGHQTVAAIASDELSPATRAEVGRILANGHLLHTPGCPLRTLADAAVWPDCVRGLGDRFAFAAPWHYQDISVCGNFDITENCKGGNCLTAQINHQYAVLANRKAAPAARVMALAFVAHFVGDLHMPLHIGEKGDRGGNEILVRYNGQSGEKLNLHHIWDTELAELALQTEPRTTPGSVTPANQTAWAKGIVQDWAKQSWDISRTVTYVGLPALADSCHGPRDANIVVPIPQTYVDAAIPVIRTQIERAGVRLGVLLNRALR